LELYIRVETESTPIRDRRRETRNKRRSGTSPTKLDDKTNKVVRPERCLFRKYGTPSRYRETLGSDRKAGIESNWLPAPNGTFSLYIRAYWAEKAVLEGTWLPPTVWKAN
jgi:hypothetical protein